jgi:hypothetical protein
MAIPTRAKYPAEVRLVTFNFRTKMSAGETITGLPTIAVSAGITNSAPQVNVAGDLVTTLLSGGTAAQDYLVTCTAGTTLGQTLKLAFSLEVRDDAN